MICWTLCTAAVLFLKLYWTAFFLKQTSWFLISAKLTPTVCVYNIPCSLWCEASGFKGLTQMVHESGGVAIMEISSVGCVWGLKRSVGLCQMHSAVERSFIGFISCEKRSCWNKGGAEACRRSHKVLTHKSLLFWESSRNVSFNISNLITAVKCCNWNC